MIWVLPVVSALAFFGVRAGVREWRRTYLSRKQRAVLRAYLAVLEADVRPPVEILETEQKDQP